MAVEAFNETRPANSPVWPSWMQTKSRTRRSKAGLRRSLRLRRRLRSCVRWPSSRSSDSKAPCKRSRSPHPSLTEENAMRITRRSIISGVEHTLDLDITEDQVASYKAGVLVQDAFPGLSKELREFFLSGITPEEWEENMKPPPDEDE